MTRALCEYHELLAQVDSHVTTALNKCAISLINPTKMAEEHAVVALLALNI